ncbi:protein with ysrik-signal peptide, partial [Lactobacillus crispatus]|nr:protein with ysrik-signal peptide [Lactobacillus crispatus]
DDRVPVKDPDHLTDGDKDKVKGEVGIVNPDLPKGTEVTVDDKGNATITYPDGSKDKIPGGDLVRPENDADRHDPHGPENPDDRVPVKDPDQLTDGDKDKVKGEVGTVNPDLPKGTEVAVGDDGTATIKYPDGSKDKIPGGDLVRPENDADKYDPKGPKNPDDRVPVKDPEHLTKDDKDKVKDEVGKVNPDLPGTIDVDDKGNATITYPDGSKDTIPGGDLVRPENDADNITPNIPGDKVTVKDPSHLTDDEKNQVKNNVDNANKDKFPAGTVITVGDDGTATITYPDTSTDTIPGDKLVKGEDSGSTSGQTDAGNITPNIPGDKVTVKDPSHLTDDEKNQVKNNVDNANKDKFPAGTEVIVGNDGTATITYPDGSQDIIPGDQLVQGQKGDTTDAGNITPTIPGGKVTVKDPSHLTDDEKNQVKDNVDNANKDKFPAGTEVTVGDDGTATIKYPDGSQDTIPGDQLVQGQKGDTTDAGNITPTIP